MSNLAAAPELPYDHLAVVPASFHDLLFVDFGEHKPHANIDLIRTELFERDPTEAVIVCLAAGGLIINDTQAFHLAREARQLSEQADAGDHVRRAALEGALARRKKATQLVGAANSVLHHEYMEDVAHDDDPEAFRDRDTMRRVLDEAYTALEQRTVPFIGEAALQTIITLKKVRIEGFPEAVRREAEQTLRVMYDKASVLASDRQSAA